MLVLLPGAPHTDQEAYTKDLHFLSRSRTPPRLSPFTSSIHSGIRHGGDVWTKGTNSIFPMQTRRFFFNGSNFLNNYSLFSITYLGCNINLHHALFFFKPHIFYVILPYPFLFIVVLHKGNTVVITPQIQYNVVLQVLPPNKLVYDI